MTDYLFLPSASLRRPSASPRFGRSAVPLKQADISNFNRKNGPKGYSTESRLPGGTFSRPLTVGLGLAGIVLAPASYIYRQPIATALGKLAARVPLPFLPTPAPSPSPAQKIVETAQSWWNGTKKVAAAGLSLLGIGGVGTLLLKNRAVEGEIPERASHTIRDINRNANVELETKFGDISQSNADVIVINVFSGLIPEDLDNLNIHNFQPGGGTGAVYRKIKGPFVNAIKDSGFRGQLGQALVLNQFEFGQNNIPARYIICMGLGPGEEFDDNAIKAVGKATIQEIKKITAAPTNPLTTVDTILHGAGIGNLDPRQALQKLLEGFEEEMREKSSAQLARLSIVENDKEKLREHLIPAFDGFVEGLGRAEE